MKEEYRWGRKGEDKARRKKAGEPEKAPSTFIEKVENRIYFYSRIEEERILQLNKNIRIIGVKLQQEAIAQNREPANIYLHINSYGGSIFAGIAGMDEIKKSAVPIYTVVDGCCASAGTFLSLCGKKRFINQHAYMLIHQLSSVMWGKYEEFKDEIKNLDKLMAMIKQIYKEYTEVPTDRLDEILKHDLWFDADECLKYGLVDEIIK